jgi:hypothetical protein
MPALFSIILPGKAETTSETMQSDIANVKIATKDSEIANK